MLTSFPLSERQDVARQLICPQVHNIIEPKAGFDKQLGYEPINAAELIQHGFCPIFRDVCVFRVLTSEHLFLIITQKGGSVNPPLITRILPGY